MASSRVRQNLGKLPKTPEASSRRNLRLGVSTVVRIRWERPIFAPRLSIPNLLARRHTDPVSPTHLSLGMTCGTEDLAPHVRTSLHACEMLEAFQHFSNLLALRQTVYEDAHYQQTSFVDRRALSNESSALPCVVAFLIIIKHGFPPLGGHLLMQ